MKSVIFHHRPPADALVCALLDAGTAFTFTKGDQGEYVFTIFEAT